MIVRWGRFVTAHAKVIFIVLLLAGLALAATSGLVRLGASDQGTQPEAQTARRAYDLLAEGFGPGFNGPIPIVVDINGDDEAPQLRGRARAPGRRLRRRARRTMRTPSRSSSSPPPRPSSEATDELVDRLRNDIVPAATEGSDAVVRLGPVGPHQGHRGADHGAAAALPALHHRRHVHRACDGVPLDRDLAHRRDHHDPLRLHRLRGAHAGRAGGYLLEPPASTEQG